MFSIRIEMNNWKFSGLNFKKFQVRFLFFDPHPNWRSQSAPSAPKTSRPAELLLKNLHSCNSSDILPNALWYESSHQSWCLRQMQLFEDKIFHFGRQAVFLHRPRCLRASLFQCPTRETGKYTPVVFKPTLKETWLVSLKNVLSFTSTVVWEKLAAMRRRVQYFVRSFPSGPSTTEKTEASGEDDLLGGDSKLQKGWLDRINHLGGPIDHWILVGYVVGYI